MGCNKRRLCECYMFICKTLNVVDRLRITSASLNNKKKIHIARATTDMLGMARAVTIACAQYVTRFSLVVCVTACLLTQASLLCTNYTFVGSGWIDRQNTYIDPHRTRSRVSLDSCIYETGRSSGNEVFGGFWWRRFLFLFRSLFFFVCGVIWLLTPPKHADFASMRCADHMLLTCSHWMLCRCDLLFPGAFLWSVMPQVLHAVTNSLSVPQVT